MKIVSDGTPIGTRLTTDDGKPIEGVQSLLITASHEGVQAEAKMFIQKLESVGLPVRMVGPNGKYISRITYMDGSFDDYSKG